MTPAALMALLTGSTTDFHAAMIPGGIEAQERRGQMEQSTAETLPIDGTSAKDRAQWEALGFTFGEPVDNLFVKVKFPEGWKKVPTDHSMWSDVVDGEGKKRAAIFYKAAFYDRSAHTYLVKEEPAK